MTQNTLLGLLILVSLSSCEEGTTLSTHVKNQNQKSHSGFSIENSERRGTSFIDSTGKAYVYYYITTRITNDSILPLRLQIDFSKEADSAKHQLESKVFLLPRNLGSMGNTENLDETKMNLGMSTDLNWFLNRVEEKPVSFDTLLYAKGICVLNFGILNEVNQVEPYAIGLKAFSDNLLHSTLALSFDRVPIEHHLIPCGQISFAPKN